MLGDFITRILVLLLGYAYPAFECYKTVEKNKAEIHELRYWCQYWILVALLTVFERVGDVFVSWLPIYGEMKVAFLIYLWYPKTKGTRYVYETLLRPYISKHETDIDRNILELRTRGLDLVVQFWQCSSRYSHTTLVQILQHLLQHVSKFTNSPINEKNDQPKPRNRALSFPRWHPPLQAGNGVNLTATDSPKAHNQTEAVRAKNDTLLDRGTISALPIIERLSRLRHAKLQPRR